jgi:hypothetical protein
LVQKIGQVSQGSARNLWIATEIENLLLLLAEAMT